MPIAGVPLLFIWIQKLLSTGVTDILLNPSRGGSYVQMIINSGIAIPRITLRPEKKPLGTAKTIWRNRDWIGKEDFFIIYGDVLTDFPIWLLVKNQEIQIKSVLTVATYKTNKPKQKGIFDVENGWVYRFREKPANPTSNMAFSGVALARNSFLEHIREGDKDIGHNVLPRMIKKENPLVFVYHDPAFYFKDIGTIPEYLSCQAEWKRLSEKQGVKRCK